MDVRRLVGAAGVGLAVAAAALLGVPALAVAAGVAGGAAALVAGRGTPGVVTASLGVATAAVLVAEAMAAADSTGAALASLTAAAGVAGCLAAGFGDRADGGRTVPSTSAPVSGTGRVAPVLGAWTALVVPSAAALAVLTASAQPLGSLLGARLAVPGLAALLLGVPSAVVVGAGWSALVGWREAGLPPWSLAAGPAALLAGWGLLVLPSRALGALLAGDLANGAPAYVLLWSVAATLVASALASAVAAEDPRFRRGPAWAAVAAGPLAVGVVLASGRGGVFVAAALATVPPAAGAFGAVVETADSSTAAAFLASLAVTGLAFAATLPARAPAVGRLTAGRPAGVGAGSLLAAVAFADATAAATVAAGGLAVLAWLLLTSGPAVEPPPRTALARAGTAALVVGGGAVLAVLLVGVVPRTDPGVGGALLLAGVAVLGVAIR